MIEKEEGRDWFRTGPLAYIILYRGLMFKNMICEEIQYDSNNIKRGWGTYLTEKGRAELEKVE
jgi:hypothetical protein